MTKQQAIAEAKKRLDDTGVIQFVLRRGNVYKVSTENAVRGWKTAEMISRGNVQNY